jgi:hypothetical protein
MIQTDISGSAGGSTTSPLGGSSSGGAFTPDPAHPDYFEFFQNTQDCLNFNTYTPGVVPYVANIACNPPFLNSPYGEIADLGAMYAQNDAYISMIGPSIPVLQRRRRLQLLQGPLWLRRHAAAAAQHRTPVHGPPVSADLGRLRGQLADRPRLAGQLLNAIPLAGVGPGV